MIKKITMLLIAIGSLAYAEKYTFYDLQNLLNVKYGVTLMVDTGIADDFVIYSKNIERDITLTNLKDVITSRGYRYNRKGNFIYIGKKSKTEKSIEKENALFGMKQKHEEELLTFKRHAKMVDEDTLFSDGLQSDLPPKMIFEICKQMNYDCSFVGSGWYLVTGKNQEVDLRLFDFDPGTQYALIGTIFEVNKQKLKDHHIDLNAFASAVLTQNWINIKLTGAYGPKLQSIQNNGMVSVEALFQFFSNQGIAKVVSKPYLVLQDNEQTIFKNGQTLTVAANTITNTEKGISETAYKTIDVGLTVDVKPRYTKNYLYLNLNLDISSLLDYDKDKNIANIAKRSLIGTYRLTPNREIKLVGFEKTYTNHKSFKVPILGDLPLIGTLFRNDYSDDQNTLLVISFKLIDTSKYTDLKYASKDTKLKYSNNIEKRKISRSRDPMHFLNIQ